MTRFARTSSFLAGVIALAAILLSFVQREWTQLYPLETNVHIQKGNKVSDVVSLPRTDMLVETTMVNHDERKATFELSPANGEVEQCHVTPEKLACMLGPWHSRFFIRVVDFPNTDETRVKWQASKVELVSDKLLVALAAGLFGALAGVAGNEKSAA